MQCTVLHYNANSVLSAARTSFLSAQELGTDPLNKIYLLIDSLLSMGHADHYQG
jgi:hypothetical protein